MTIVANTVGACAVWMTLVAVALPGGALAQDNVATDRATLAALYDATGGPTWTNSTNWKTLAPLGEWHGVTTDAEGRATGLSLPANLLAGQLPAGLGRLGRLEILSLRENELTGPVPRWLGHLPRLRSIDLGSNALTGPVPAALERLGSLEHLSLRGNGLTGLVPAWLGGLVTLRLLDLGGNALTGSVPSSLEHLRDLEYLSLGGNRLTGPIPSWLGRMPNLRVLDLGANRLVGPIPARLGDLVQLQWLALDRNELVGGIPGALEQLTELEHLSLGGNDLVGPIPSRLGRLGKLAWLDLHDNRLHGPIPDGLQPLGGLEHLSLRGNELSGPAPPWLGDLVNLRALDLGSNALSGALPPTLGNLVHLRALHVDGTSLTGSLPQELTRSPELALLTFHDSPLCAPVDVGFGQWLASLEEWTGTMCSGRPRSLGESTPAVAARDRGTPDAGDPRLPTAIDAAAGPRGDRAALVALFNATGGPRWRNKTNWKTGRPLGQWHGVTTDSSGRVVRLTLGRNRLTGRLPPALGRLTRLRVLRLDSNELTGRIPRALSNLTDLNGLALNNNDLTGRIPGALGRLTNLHWLNLNETALIGPVPSELGRLTRLEELLLRSWGLTGRLPAGLRRLPLRELAVFGSQTCAPPGWRTWVRTIDFDGALCGARPDATIDVLVVYTPAAARRLGATDAVDARIDLLIAETNEAFRASGVRPRVTLVGRSEVPYIETGDSSVDLGRLAHPSDGHMDRVHSMRRRTGADLVHLLVGESDVGGRAGDDFSLSVAGFSARVFAHELGHNMGLNHDRYEEAPGVGASPNYGYVNQRAFEGGAPASSRWRTIMAYPDQCSDAGSYCREVMRFSNPRQRLHGDPLGIPFRSGPWGLTGPADAAAWLNRVGRMVAARRHR